MNIAEAKEQIRNTVEDYLELDEIGDPVTPIESQRPLFLLGAPGIGKTAIMSQVAGEMGIGLVSYSMTHHTRQSALGLPFIVHKQYGDEEFDVSEYTMSEIIASLYDYMQHTGHEQGILFLDEINCVSETLYPSMLQFLQFKTFGRHRIPNGWIVVCAGNPPEYNKSVYDFDVVTLDRLRKIDVEPDLGAWLSYARSTGVHPAIITYLEIKHDQFYIIESTPAGKSFVTARGWDDLSKSIRMAEAKGRAVSKALIGQFLQNDESVERFAQYYALFDKYRSDYQVIDILAGSAGKAIADRARSARFDERLALMRLIADSIDTRCAAVMEHADTVALARDAIRASKDALAEGASVQETIGTHADSLSASAAKSKAADTASQGQMKCSRQAASKLREYALSCDERRLEGGIEAFEAIAAQYAQDASELKAQADSATQAIGHAYSFLEEAFGSGREMDSFTTDLTARSATSRFIARFGSDAYYAHNNATASATIADELRDQVASFDLEAAETARIAAELAAARAAACGPCDVC